MDYKNEYLKNFEKENGNHFIDYRLENEDEKQKYISEKLSNLRLHNLIQRIENISSIMGLRCC